MTSARERRTRAARVWSYLAVTFPPLPMFATMLFAVVAIYFTFEAIGLRVRLAYTWRMIGVAVSCFLVTLLLRVYDELKDAETDRRLAAAGDPKYRDRPIVTGVIDVDDLQALRWGITVVAFVLNAALGLAVLGAFVVVYVATWMSLHWFFWPKMREQLLLAFVTHNPLTFLLNVYVVVAFTVDFGLVGLTLLPILATLLARQAVVSAWELARKIRAPEDETEYLTYSRVLGWRVAPFLSLAAVVLATACFVWVGHLANLGPLYAIVATSAALVPIVALLRFRFAPSTKTAKLQLPVEIFAGIESLAVLVALIARWGVVLTPVR